MIGIAVISGMNEEMVGELMKAAQCFRDKSVKAIITQVHEDESKRGRKS